MAGTPSKLLSLKTNLKRKMMHHGANPTTAALVLGTLLVVVLVVGSLAWVVVGPRAPAPRDWSGRVAVVVDCHPDSVGLAVAERLVAWNAKVVCGVSQRPQLGGGNSVQLHAERRLNASVVRTNSKGSARVVALDMADFESVRAFAALVRAEHRGVHALVLSSAVWPSDEAVTRDGLDVQVQVLHLSPFLLLRLLSDKLEASGKSHVDPAHVVLLTSAAAYWGGVHPQTLEFDGSAKRRSWATYADARLMSRLVAREFARRAGPEAVVKAVAVSPGLFAYPLSVGSATDRRLLVRAVSYFLLMLRSPQAGAARVLRVLGGVEPSASGDALDAVLPTGWFVPSGATETSARWLWSESSRVVGVAP